MAAVTSLRATPLTRASLSKRTCCNIETIRSYEQIGLMPDPPRGAGGHRLYGERHRKRLIFVRRARQLGFGLEEVRGLSGLVEDGDNTCAEVKAPTPRRVSDIREKIVDLRKIERVPSDMAARCDDGELPDCPVIDALFEQDD